MRTFALLFFLIPVFAFFGCQKIARFSENELLKYQKLTSNVLNDSACVKILFMGDLYFGEFYQDSLPENLLKTKGYLYSFENILPLLKSCNYVVANLETTLAPYNKNHVVHPDKPIVHYSDTSVAPVFLNEIGINAVSLANNHSMDFSETGLRTTLDLLEKHNIQAFGAGNNETNAALPYLVATRFSEKQRNLYIFGGMQYYKTYDKKFNFYATKNAAGVNLLTTAILVQEINRVKKTDPKALVLVFPHWGYNYTWKTPRQNRLAKMLLYAGADLIIGHGAHRVQEIEFVNKKPVLHSIGNSVFNSQGRYDKLNSEKYSMLVVLMLKPEGYTLKCYPILSDNNITSYQPRFLNDAEMIAFIDIMNETNGHKFNAYSVTGQDSTGHFFSIGVN